MAVDYSSREYNDRNRGRDRDSRRRERERRDDRKPPKWWILFEKKQTEATGFTFGIVAKKGQLNSDADSNSWDSRASAEDEAERLSQDNPDTSFLVVEAVSGFHSKSTVRTQMCRF